MEAMRIGEIVSSMHFGANLTKVKDLPCECTDLDVRLFFVRAGHRGPLRQGTSKLAV